MNNAQRAEDAHRKLLESYDAAYWIGDVLDRHPDVEAFLNKLAEADAILDRIRKADVLS